ncbi:MAG: DctP family TRAP transporter solute-binding subunit [Firmicutes bacterium]|nr:DctP family TRAP transporter solute-binding subunit [Bacillota bacterium]
MKKKLFTLLMCLMVISLMFAGCGGKDNNGGEAGDTVVWKLAHQETTGTMFDMYANHFAELVAEKSDGRIKVEIYPVGQLGDTGTQVEMLMNGGIQLGIFASGDVGDMFPAVQALSLNFIFSDDDAVNAQVLTEGEATAYLDEMFAGKNLATYDWFSLGNMQWGTTKPIRTLDDFKGFKMRIMASPIIAANYEAFGAAPTPLAFTETYSGLQLKTVEGTEQPVNAMEEMKFYEVVDYITMSNHSQLASFMSMNKDFYEGLSDEDKAMLEEIKPEMREYALTTLGKVLSEKEEIIKENRPELEFIELTDAERQAFVDASLPVRDRITEFGGEEAKKVLDLVLADVEKFEK